MFLIPGIWCMWSCRHVSLSEQHFSSKSTIEYGGILVAKLYGQESVCKRKNLICDDFDDVISHFLSLCAAPGCSTSLLSNRKDLMLLWTRLCRKPPAVLCMCERQTLGRLQSKSSVFYLEVMSENGFRLFDQSSLISLVYLSWDSFYQGWRTSRFRVVNGHGDNPSTKKRAVQCFFIFMW